MGGRTSSGRSPLISDRETWITELSDKRLLAYENVMNTSHAKRRVDGSSRTEVTQTYFKDLISTEKTRRGL